MQHRRAFLQGGALALGAVAAGQAGEPPKAPQAPPTPADNHFGVNLHLDRFPPDLAFKQLAQAKAMGVGWVRGVTCAWANVERKKGEWNFDRPDRELEVVEAVGLQPLGCLGPSVKWAAPLDPESQKAWWGWSNYPPGDLGAWGDCVSRVVCRYKGRIRHWSPWNEPDNFGFFWPAKDKEQQKDAKWLQERREAFLKIQRTAHAAAKKADPECLVLSGAFAMGGDYDKEFVPWLIRNGLGAVCDVVDVHMYWSVANIRRTIGDTRRWLAEAGTPKPLWMTEIGASLRHEANWIGPFTHDQLQSYAPKVLATVLALGIEKTLWYQGYTEGNSPMTLEKSEFSLAVTDGPTPAAWSFAAAVRLLRAARFLGDAKLEAKTGRAVGHCFATPEGEAAVLWALSPDGLDNRPARAEAVLDWQGRRIPVVLSERPTILLTGAPHPVE